METQGVSQYMMLYAYFNGLIEGCQKHFNNL